MNGWWQVSTEVELYIAHGSHAGRSSHHTLLPICCCLANEGLVNLMRHTGRELGPRPPRTRCYPLLYDPTIQHLSKVVAYMKKMSLWAPLSSSLEEALYKCSVWMNEWMNMFNWLAKLRTVSSESPGLAHAHAGNQPTDPLHRWQMTCMFRIPGPD